MPTLILKNAVTPRGTLEAVLEVILDEAARFRQQAKAAPNTHRRNREEAVVNALLTIHMRLADCDIMQGEP